MSALTDLQAVVTQNTDITARAVAETQRLTAKAESGSGTAPAGGATDADLTAIATALATNNANLTAALDTSTSAVPA